MLAEDNSSLTVVGLQSNLHFQRVLPIFAIFIRIKFEHQKTASSLIPSRFFPNKQIATVYIIVPFF